MFTDFHWSTSPASTISEGELVTACPARYIRTILDDKLPSDANTDFIHEEAEQRSLFQMVLVTMTTVTLALTCVLLCIVSAVSTNPFTVS